MFFGGPNSRGRGQYRPIESRILRVYRGVSKDRIRGDLSIVGPLLAGLAEMLQLCILGGAPKFDAAQG